MRLFSSARERRLWLWALAVVAAIYSTLGLAGTMARTLREFGLLDVSTWVLVAMFLVGMTILTQGLRVRPGGVEIAVMLGVAAVYLLLFLRSTASPAERTHLMEYGVLGVFIHEALAERVSQGRRVPVPPVVAVVLTTVLGVALTRGSNGFCRSGFLIRSTCCSISWRATSVGGGRGAGVGSEVDLETTPATRNYRRTEARWWTAVLRRCCGGRQTMGSW